MNVEKLLTRTPEVARAFYGLFGGRKMFAGYLYTGLVVWIGLRLEADFVAIAGFMAGGLGITSGAVAFEDRGKDLAEAKIAAALIEEGEG